MVAPASEVEGARPGAIRGWRSTWVLLVLAVAGIAVSLLSHHFLFPAYSWNRDEPVYLWHIEVLRSGRLVGTDGGAPDFFRPWLTAAVDGTLVSQYTLGWPLVLLAGATLLGSPFAGVAFGTALAVIGVHVFTHVVTGDRRLAGAAAAVFLACPIVLIQSGVHLGYLFTLGLGLLFLASLVRGLRTGRRGLLLVAGALDGWILMTRPLDAVLWGAAGAAYLAFEHRRELHRLAGALPWAALGAAPLVVATFAYNWRVTGSPTVFPITAADPLDTLGFGRRRIMPAGPVVPFGLLEALRGTARNAFEVPSFLFGSWLGVVAAGAGLWLRRRVPTTLLLVAVGSVFPLGYFFFWGIHLTAPLAELSGPYYYLPAFAPASVLVAAALLHAWDHRRRLAIAALAALVTVTVPLSASHAARNREISRNQVAWREAKDALPPHERVLVFVDDTADYLLFSDPFASNGPTLDDRVLFAVDRGAANLDLMARHADRRPYLQRTARPLWRLLDYDRPVAPAVEIVPVQIAQGARLLVSAQVVNPTAAPAVRASVDDGGTVSSRSLALDSRRGAVHAARWQVGLGDGVDVPLGDRRRGRITVTVGFGADDEAAIADPVLRLVFGYRIVDGTTVEIATPGTWERFRTRRGIPRWEPDPSPSVREHLEVTIAPA